MRFHLRRIAESPDGTFGRMEVSETVFHTLEEEGLENQRNVSRIPAGTYLCRRTVYHRHGYETFEVTGVPDRDRVLFHIGNTEEDTDGCILLGLDSGLLEVVDEDTGELTRKIGVYHSRVAFRMFMQFLSGVDEFELEITDPEWRI